MHTPYDLVGLKLLIVFMKSFSGFLWTWTESYFWSEKSYFHDPTPLETTLFFSLLFWNSYFKMWLWILILRICYWKLAKLIQKLIVIQNTGYETFNWFWILVHISSIVRDCLTFCVLFVQELFSYYLLFLHWFQLISTNSLCLW